MSERRPRGFPLGVTPRAISYLKEKTLVMGRQNKTNESRLDQALEKFYSNINKALDVACPKQKKSNIDKNNPWWSDKLQNEWKELSKLYETQLKRPTEVNIRICKQQKSKFAKHYRKAQAKGWNTFMHNTDSIGKTNILWKFTRAEPRKSEGNLKNQIDHSPTQDLIQLTL